MFFFGVFGIDTKQAEIRDIRNIVCKSCGRMSSYTLLKSNDYFHIFFIPVYSWGHKYYLMSKCCGALFEIPLELGLDLERGKDIPIRDEDLTPVYQYNEAPGNFTTCSSCGKFVGDDFTYCPYCGKKIR